jgi:hypothetical protein
MFRLYWKEYMKNVVNDMYLDILRRGLVSTLEELSVKQKLQIQAKEDT